MRYKTIVIIMIVLLSISIFFSNVFATENCPYGFVKKNGSCQYFDASAYTYSINQDIISSKPFLFGHIKVVGGNYIDINNSTTTHRAIKTISNSQDLSTNILIFNDFTVEKDFAMYSSEIINDFNYLGGYKFFFNLKYQSQPDKNVNLSLPFSLNK